ncbi:hypothetical protein D3C76_1135480 [compost metagenome]
MIQIRRFGGPLFWLLHIHAEIESLPLTDVGLRFALIQPLFAVEKLNVKGDVLRLGGQVFQLDVAGESGVAIVVVEGCGDGEIVDVRQLATHQIDVAEDARRPPHILIFDVG